MDTKDEDWKILQENNESEGGGDMNECAFFYESNEAALKGNADYQQLLTTIVMLESQRSQAVKDLDTLLEIQQKASSDPVDFVSKLQYKVDMGIPKPQKIAELPYISWGQYIYNMKDIFNSYGSKQFTRLKNKSDPLDNIKDVKRSHNSDHDDVDRPATFNQSWSAEEQKLLEKLLIKHPPEKFESRRWYKIARELKNRTPQQVASRVQKYFIKLARAGLPIPGRIPNLAAHGGKGSSNHRHQRFNRFYYPASTFLTSYEPPVFMSEDDDLMNDGSTGSLAGRLDSYDCRNDLGDNSFGTCHRYFDDHQPIKTENFSKANVKQRSVIVDDKKCCRCAQILVGVYWRCVECPRQDVYICEKCSKCEYSEDHLLRREYNDQDQDYTNYSSHEYSYLDSNAY